MAEANAGMRCDGCGERMIAPGMEFVAFRAVVEGNRPTMVTERRFACSREECDDYRDELRSQAVAMRPIDGWVFLDGG